MLLHIFPARVSHYFYPDATGLSSRFFLAPFENISCFWSAVEKEVEGGKVGDKIPPQLRIDGRTRSDLMTELKRLDRKTKERRGK